MKCNVIFEVCLKHQWSKYTNRCLHEQNLIEPPAILSTQYTLCIDPWFHLTPQVIHHLDPPSKKETEVKKNTEKKKEKKRRDERFVTNNGRPRHNIWRLNSTRNFVGGWKKWGKEGGGSIMIKSSRMTWCSANRSRPNESIWMHPKWFFPPWLYGKYFVSHNIKHACAAGVDRNFRSHWGVFWFPTPANMPGRTAV